VGRTAPVGGGRAPLRVRAAVTQGLVLLLVLLVTFAGLAHRRRELAVLRALGASRAYVCAAVGVQVFGMLAAGAGLGLLAGWLGGLGIARFAQARIGLTLPVAVGAPELRLVPSALLRALP